MPANSTITVTGLSFDTIRANLRNYISSKSEFADFDFEDSSIGTLLDLLAYNTYYNAFYVNMATNESFLDSAQKYDSVVSHAKNLGYLPTSSKGAVANLYVRFGISSSPSVQTLTIAKNSQFTASVNGSSYTFVTPKSYSISANSSGIFSGYINIIEGTPLTHNYLYTTSNTSFILPNPNAEVSSITVSARVNGNTQTFAFASDIFTVNSSAKVYYVDADRDGLYKVSFGDNVLGVRPDYNSTVYIDYRVCNTTKGNGANLFTGPALLGGQSNYSITVIDRSSGGAAPESIESIREKAPKVFQTQNRAVTKYDYENLMLQLNPDLDGVSVWGGEENNPPIYGKVYACVKPRLGTLISTNRKSMIIDQMKEYNVQSIDMEMVDATYMYIVPFVTVRYNPDETTLTASQVGDAVAARVISFEESDLDMFGKKFRFSKFLNYLSLSENSIVDVRANIDLEKRFSPSTIINTNYVLSFNQQLKHFSGDSNSASLNNWGYLTSSEFVYLDNPSFFDDDGFGTLRIYYKKPSLGKYGRVYTNQTAGTIDYDNGTVYINAFQPSSYDEEIKILMRPSEENVEPIRNQILLFADTNIKIVNDKNNKIEATILAVNTIGSSTSLSAVTSAIQGITTF